MRRRHLHLDIEGGIRNAATLKGVITVDGKTLMTVKEIRAFLREQLALGHKVLPMDDCDNFDYQTGCRGHRGAPLGQETLGARMDGGVDDEKINN